MKTAFGLFFVSAALFICGVSFVVVGARSARNDAVPSPRLSIAPVGSVKQIMNGIVAPAATVVFTSVATNITAAGVEEIAPRNDAEWESVGNSAVALAESANLMMFEGRAVDRADWITMSEAMRDAGRKALQAVEARDVEGLLASGEAINTSCDNCHQRYQRN